jgi:A/G-specific adenine glycosylase
MTKRFSSHVLAWYDKHGRKHLPWQGQDAYRVWLSEIMLQQTQVKTVLSYYQSFIERYPTVTALAQAPLDDVLTLWSGLGYYARARNAHQCAQIISHDYGGEFPANLEALMELPGIGRSTAGAILALAFHQKAAILDGNVKRVLCRYAGIQGVPTATNTQQELWALAETLTPSKRVADYTQAMMDLGAMVCTRHRPACSLCPLQKTCFAFQEDQTANLPTRKKQIAVPIQHKQFLVLMDDKQHILLIKRPAEGIWGGLWSFPEYEMHRDLVHECQQQWGIQIDIKKRQAPISHRFSHFQLIINPIIATITHRHYWTVLDNHDYFWYDPYQSASIGVPKPIKDVLHFLKNELENIRLDNNAGQ